ncbi:hypothetical protein quinque_012447 [Culex quinquefasciatus]
MKSLLPSILALATLAGVVTCGPIAISDNNIGDIITVGMNIDANVQSEVHTNIANIIAAILIKMGDQQQRPPMPPPGPPGPPGPPPTTPAPPILPPIYPPQPAMGVDDLVSAIQEIRQKSANLSKEQKEQLWRDHSEEFVKQLMASSLNPVSADPIQVSSNNFGDLTAVGLNLNANIASSVNVNIANVIAAILIQLGDLNLDQLPANPDVSGWPQLPPSLNPEEQKLVSVVVDKLKHH